MSMEDPKNGSEGAGETETPCPFAETAAHSPATCPWEGHRADGAIADAKAAEEAEDAQHMLTVDTRESIVLRFDPELGVVVGMATAFPITPWLYEGAGYLRQMADGLMNGRVGRHIQQMQEQANAGGQTGGAARATKRRLRRIGK